MLKIKSIIYLIFFSISSISLSAVFNTMEVYDREKTQKIDYIGFYQEGMSNFAITGNYDETNLEILDTDRYYLNLGNQVYHIALIDENYKIKLGDKEYKIGFLQKSYAIEYNNYSFDEFKTKEFINISIGKNNKLKNKVSGFVYNSSEKRGYFFLGDFDGLLPNVYKGCIGVIYDERTNNQGKNYKVMLFRGSFYIEKLIQGVDSLYKNTIFDFSQTFPLSGDILLYKCITNEKDTKITSVSYNYMLESEDSLEKMIKDRLKYY